MFPSSISSDKETSGMKYKVLITHDQIPQCGIDMLKDKYELIICDSKGEAHPTREEILGKIKGVDAVLWFGHIKVDKQMIDAAGENLKVIGSMGAGYDHIDVKYAVEQRKIKVSNTPDILSSAVADMAMGLALAVSRNILQGYKSIIENKWVDGHPTWMCGPALEGSTVGIIGFGAIGTKIAKRIKTFDINELLYSSPRERPEASEIGAKYVTLDKLLESSDFVFVSVPLTPATTEFLNMEQFSKMKPTSILINVSRGGVIKQDDLVKALKNKMIWGAGLDVLTPEPLPHDHELTTLPNVVLTPHISSATFRARETMAKLAAENIINGLSNKPLVSPIPVK